MKHDLKASVKRLLYGVYTYDNSLVNHDINNNSFSKYYNNRIFNTNIDVVRVPHAIRTSVIDKRISSILKNLSAGLDEAVLIISPYRSSVLTALLLVKTDTPSRITYTVKGIRGSDDYTTGEASYSKTHRIPIVGLFENTMNHVILTVEQKDRITCIKKILIKMPSVSKKYYKSKIKLSVSDYSAYSNDNHFYLLSGGYFGPTYIFDSHSNVRAFLSRIPQYYGLYSLENGRFLFSESEYKRPTFGAPLSVMTHEMDWLGRYHHTYFHDKGYHHHAIELPDHNILTLSSSFYDSYTENLVIKVDRNTGAVLEELNVNELFDDTYKTRNDWCHINSIELTGNPDELILCSRNIHTIMKVNMKDKRLIWIFSNPDMFKGTAQESLVLKPENDFNPWFFQQHSAYIIKDYPDAVPGRIYLSFYDNHDSARRPVKWYDKDGTSYGLIVSIDENARTVRMEKRYPTTYSTTRANTYLDTANSHYYTMDARYPESVNGYMADMRIMDYESGKLLYEYKFNYDFFSIHPVTFDYNSMCEPLDTNRTLFRGELYKASMFNKPDSIEQSEYYKTADIRLRFTIYGDILAIWGMDQELSEIILVGNTCSYHIDYMKVTDDITLKQPIGVLRNQKYWHLMPMKGIVKDHYDIYIKYNDIYYRTDKYVDIKSSH